MRVIAGSLKGRKLQTPPKRDIRPTSDRVKEGMFSILQFSLPNARVLDLFSGTGQLGIEALSRGATSCTFVDQSPSSCRLTRQNISLCGLEEKATTFCCSAEKFLASSSETYTILLLDPPYGQEILPKLLPLAAKRTAPGGLVLCEAEHTLELPETVETIRFFKKYKYCKIKLIVYKRERSPL